MNKVCVECLGENTNSDDWFCNKCQNNSSCIYILPEEEPLPRLLSGPTLYFQQKLQENRTPSISKESPSVKTSVSTKFQKQSAISEHFQKGKQNISPSNKEGSEIQAEKESLKTNRSNARQELTTLSKGNSSKHSRSPIVGIGLSHNSKKISKNNAIPNNEFDSLQRTLKEFSREKSDCRVELIASTCCTDSDNTNNSNSSAISFELGQAHYQILPAQNNDQSSILESNIIHHEASAPYDIQSPSNISISPNISISYSSRVLQNIEPTDYSDGLPVPRKNRLRKNKITDTPTSPSECSKVSESVQDKLSYQNTAFEIEQIASDIEGSYFMKESHKDLELLSEGSVDMLVPIDCDFPDNEVLTSNILGSQAEMEIEGPLAKDYIHLDRTKIIVVEEKQIRVGDMYQAVVPDFLPPAASELKRTFKPLWDPSFEDPEVICVIEEFVKSDLGLENISSEKLLRWVYKSKCAIPELFMQIAQNKEKMRKRLGWNKQKSRLVSSLL